MVATGRFNAYLNLASHQIPLGNPSPRVDPKFARQSLKSSRLVILQPFGTRVAAAHRISTVFSLHFEHVYMHR
jgi:hypothetical protein